MNGEFRTNKIYYNPPLILKKMFANFIWNSRCGKVILTFDDGPNPETTGVILKTLEELKAEALFFVVGENLKRYGTLASEIISEGHTLGNHAFSHKILTKISKNERRAEIEKTLKVSLQTLNYEMKFFRPPHGKFPPFLNGFLAGYGLRNVMWSLLTYDFKNNFNIVKFAINNFLTDNSVVVFHDSLKSKDVVADAIKYLAEKVYEKGYEFGKIEECLN